MDGKNHVDWDEETLAFLASILDHPMESGNDETGNLTAAEEVDWEDDDEYESEEDLARGEGFWIDDDGNWIPIDDDW